MSSVRADRGMLVATDQRATAGTPDLSHASAGAALAHANRKSVEIWRPGRLTDAEKAAFSVRDFNPPEIPQPSTQYSAEGLGAAILAVREQRGMSSLQPTQTGHKHDISLDQSHALEKARRAATGAYATRRRSGSAPSESGAAATESPYARFAAGALQHGKAEDENPLGHLDSAMEASRIQHVANTNAQLYTSHPPVAGEVEERNRQNSLRAAAVSMAKDMYDVTGPPGEPGQLDPAIYAAQKGQEQERSRKTVSGALGSTAQRALTLQDAAQKRAAEKLARMQDEHSEMQHYYGTAPQPQRSLLATRRKRTSSEADVSHVDAEQSRHIRSQMTSLRTKVNRVDEKRLKDRELLMEAARRNVDATIQGMERKLYADTGRAPPSMQRDWDEAAQERVRREAEAVEASGAQENRVNIGVQQYIDMADVEAVARSRVQPALDEITDQAEKRRAQELEARLDAEEQQRHAALEKEREADMRAAESRGKGRYLSMIFGRHRTKRKTAETDKRDSKGMKLFLWRKKSKRASAEHRQPKEEETAVHQEPMAPAGQGATVPPETTAVSNEALAQEEPETAGAASVASATPLPAPVILREPTDYVERPSIVRSHTAHQDAAAVGPGVDAMHTIRPVTSPRADSKLKNWFRDRLVRRSSGPVRVYPHQPGPEYNTDSEVGFTGGAALAGRNEPRGAALSSHPITGADLGQSDYNNGRASEANGSPSAESATSQQDDNGNGNGKRQRLRRSLMKSVSRSSPDKNNGSDRNGGHSRQGSDAVAESKGAELSGLRDSAAEQGLPLPPILGKTTSTGRESRFSEDL